MLKSNADRKSSKLLLSSLQRLALILGLATAGSLVRALPVLAAPAIGGTVIENQATGSYVDGDIPGDASQDTVSNIVKVKVAEVAGVSITAQIPTVPSAGGTYPNNAAGTAALTAGPYQGFGGIQLGNIVYFDFVISNDGNDPTQFVIPSTATVSNGTVGQLQIIKNGSTTITPVNVPVTFAESTNRTGALLGAVNGSIPAGGTITVRVPVIVNSESGDVKVLLGDTSTNLAPTANPLSNQPYTSNTNSVDVYTLDNSDPASALTPAANNEVIGAPANGIREASATYSVPVEGKKVSGNVFEDKNYGGGSGRNKTDAGGVGVNAATVELYDSNGKFVRSANTDANGDYSFPTVPLGEFYVRVVNRTVKSNRPGSIATLVPVQTFLTNAIGTAVTVSDVTDRVGGEAPTQVDTGAGGLNAIFSTTTKQFTTAGGSVVVGDYIQSLTRINAGTAVVSGVDFGFNFDTIVNTNDSGQGSLRQFVINSNNLTNTPTNLTQVDQAAGKEVSIFMISDGAAHNGIRAMTSQLTGNRALIKLNNPLTITDTNTSIEGSTQTNKVSNSNNQTLGAGGTVGVDSSTLSQLNTPEVEITNNTSGIANGINIDTTATNTTVSNIAIHGFGSASGSNQSDILVQGDNASLTKNMIGTTALSFAAPTAQSQSGIIINGAKNVSITNNLIGFTNERGILGSNGATAVDLSGLVISDNEIRSTGNGAGTTDRHGGIELYPSTVGNVSILKNLITASGTDSGIEVNTGATGTATNFLIQNNTLSNNGSGSSGFGIVLQGIATTNDISGIKVDKNILDTNRLGITSRQSNVTISENVVHDSIGGYGIGIESGKLGNFITKNSTYNNAGPGIDIATGTTANGITPNNGTTDTTLSNKGIDYPLITATSFDSTTFTLDVKGYVGIAPAGNSTFAGVTLEFFLADNSTDTAQNGAVIVGDGKTKPHGEGKTYLGSCTADSLGRFGLAGNLCTFTNTTLLTSANYNKITATATATEIDGSKNTSEFSASPSTRAKLILVKRITAIKDGTSNVVTSFDTSFIDGTGTDDDSANWPANYIKGVIDAGQAKPGDEIEYTIYYQNAGENRISAAKVCDRLNTNLVYQEDFDAAHVGKGIALTQGSGATQYFTGDTIDADRGMLSTTLPLPSDCNILGTTVATGTLSNNVVVVEAANSTNPIPGLTSGYIKFKAKVQQ
jgi:SdrD B-like domain/Right handed beta helix region